MRILVLGAGATGGYFGGRLAEAGRDVTFLVRAPRAELLRQTGLRIRSPLGDAHISKPRCVLSEKLVESYDLIILSCKAYGLDEAITSIAPAVGTDTAILPLLNGMRHLDLLEAKFGASKVLGGVCVIAATIGQDGTIIHLNDVSSLTFGSRFSSTSPQVNAITQQMTGAKFSARASETIIHDMWEKWVFLATLASSTCLMRGAIGDVIGAPNGLRMIESIFSECTAIATRHGFAPREKAIAQAAAMLTTPSSSFTSSMMRDIENRSRIEADHVVGDLLARGNIDSAQSVMLLAYTHMKAYEARRAREWEKVRTPSH